ncbi:MAG: DNA translocase FtsK [Clostridia bacterium]|nr:DNA translocase FtsK [Clostridia bacterium]
MAAKKKTDTLADAVKKNTKKNTSSKSAKTGSGGNKSSGARSKNNAPAKNVSREKAKLTKQNKMILLAGAAAIFLAVTLIKGEHVWLAIHNFFFFMFGITAYFWPLMFIFIILVIATKSSLFPEKIRIIGSAAFVMIISGIIHLFSTASQVGSLGEQIAYIWDYRADVVESAGGFFGALFGGIPIMLFGRVAAGILLFILLIVVFCLLADSLVVTAWLFVVGKIKNGVSERKNNRPVRDDNEEEIPVRRKGFKPTPLGPSFTDEEDDGMYIEELVGNEKKREVPENKKAPKPFIDITTGEVIEDTEPNFDEILHKINKPKPAVKAVKVKEKEPEQEKPKTEEPFAKPPVPKTEKKETKEENTSSALFKPVYRKPDATCLNYANNADSADYEEELKYKAKKLVDTLNSFGVSTKIVDICRGPSVTRYELQPAAGVKISKITSLADDLALALASTGVRIEAPIPNKSAVGIEVPNKNRSTVSLREILETPVYQNAKSKLNVALGKDIAGNTICADIAKMPHLLIAGTTGSGKSVCLNAMIVSILMNATPDEVKLVMIDPKQVEFTVYNGIPHLLVPVVSDPRKAAGALGWAVTEMLQRYKMFSEKAVRDIKGYNRLAETDETLTPMPHIVIFIDELSDLMMAAPNEVEDSICRLAQMARAAGMHLVIATQRPSVNVITGIIKANIPSRIALSVSSQVDSRTILDSAGAEKLLGNGDMLFGPVGVSKPIRVQGCFLSDEEVEGVCKFIKNQSNEEKTYDEDVMKEIENQQAAMETKKTSSAAMGGGDSDGGSDGADEMLPKAIEVVVEAQMASTTLLQRKLKLGYARAARIVDELEQRQIVGPFEGSKPRKVLISKQQWMEMNALGNASAPIENPIEEDNYDDEEND